MTFPAGLFVDVMADTIAIAERRDLLPPKGACPCYDSLCALEEAGVAIAEGDPLPEIAGWERLAWSAEKIGGKASADFARICRAFADELALEVST